MNISPNLEEMLDLVEINLTRSSSLVRFDAPIEQKFRAKQQDEQARHYVITCTIGLVLFNFFLIIDLYLMPDIVNNLAVIQLLFVTPIGALLTLLIGKRVIDPPQGATVIMLLILAVIVYAALGSRLPDSVMMAFALPPIILFSNIALPLPIKTATAVSLICLIISIIIVASKSNVGIGKQILLVDTILTIAVYSLLATFRIEKLERKFFLIAMRDQIRSEILTNNNHELRELSDTDALTGIGNRRHFEAVYEKAWTASDQTHAPIGVLVIDIDHFKAVNDRQGHLVGDRCLRVVAECVGESVRSGGSNGGAQAPVFRFGGEEFIVLLERAPAAIAARVAERVRSAVEALVIPLDPPGSAVLKLTVSIGVASGVPRGAFTRVDLLAAADRALYEAKSAGRNRVELGVSSVELRSLGDCGPASAAA